MFEIGLSSLLHTALFFVKCKYPKGYSVLYLFPIAGLFIPGASIVSKGIGAGIKTLVGATGGAIETTHQHASALDLHKIIGSFDASSPKSYEPVISAFSDIFIHFNLQFIYLLDENKLDFHLNKAMYKLALDSGGLHLL